VLGLVWLVWLYLVELKIDCAFVCDMFIDEVYVIIVLLFIGLVYNLGLIVVVEGVEDDVMC